jgi:exopolysaccharide biosynthesis protein
MNRHSPLRLLLPLLLISASLLAGEWFPIERGVHYREIRRDGIHAHVVRVDLGREDLAVAATREGDKGIVVSRFAELVSAIVAVNGDYFDAAMRPVGHAIGGGDPWEERHGTRNQPILAFGAGRAEILTLASRHAELPGWVEEGVSGWPLLISDCTAIAAADLPGSDAFTRAPHPRTAAGLSGDGTTLFLLVADGRREGVPGLTLPELGSLLRELGACSAVNLDGGGSSAMVIEGELVNQPSDGIERIVANHLAIVPRPSACPPDGAAARTP